MSVTFAFLGCPACKKPMSIDFTKPKIGKTFEKWVNYRTRIETMAKEFANEAGLRQSPRLTDPTDPYYLNWTGLALSSCTFYECARCYEPYFGGMIGCR